MNTLAAVLVTALPFGTGIFAVVGAHRWLRSDGYGAGRAPSSTPDWSAGNLPSRPYATLR